MKLKYSLTILICYFSILCFAQKERITSIYLKHDELNTSLLEERYYDKQDRLVKTTTYRYYPYKRKCSADSAWSYDTKVYEYNESGELISETEYSKNWLYKKRVKVTDSKSSITKEYKYTTEVKHKDGLEIKETRVDTTVLEWIKFNKGKVTEKRVYPNPLLNPLKYVQENWTYKGSFLKQYSIENFYSESIKKQNYSVSENEKITIYYRPDLDSIPERIEFSEYQDNQFKKNTIFNFDLEGRVVEEIDLDEDQKPDYNNYTRYYYFGKNEYAHSCRSTEKMDEDISEMDCGGIELGYKTLDYEWVMYSFDTSYNHINHERNFEYAVYEQTKNYVIGYEDIEESFVYLNKRKDSILYANTIIREEKEEYDKANKVYRSVVYGQENSDNCKNSYGKIMETVTDSLRKSKTRITYHTSTAETPHPIEDKYILDWATGREIRKIEYVPSTGKVYRFAVYGYDSKGNLISENDSITLYKNKKYIKYEYDNAGLLKSRNTIIKNFTETQEYFEYARNGNLKNIKKIMYENGHKDCDIIIYDSTNALCRIDDLNGAQCRIEIRHLEKTVKDRDSTIIRYNPQLKIEEKRIYKKHKLVDGFFDEFNERGQLTRSYNNEAGLDVYLIYDSTGRLVEKKTYKPGIKPYLMNHEVYIHNFLPGKLETYKNLSINKKYN